MTETSPEFRRALAVLLLTLSVVLAYELAVAPLLAAHRDLDSGWREGALRLAHYNRVSGTLDALKAEHDQLQTAGDGPRPYLTAESKALAIAELQAFVGTVVEKNGVELVGMRVLTRAAEDGFQSLALRVSVKSTLPPLQATFYELEARYPILFIDALSIQRRVGGQGGRSDDTDPLLDTAFDVIAYRKALS